MRCARRPARSRFEQRERLDRAPGEVTARNPSESSLEQRDVLLLRVVATKRYSIPADSDYAARATAIRFAERQTSGWQTCDAVAAVIEDSATISSAGD